MNAHGQDWKFTLMLDGVPLKDLRAPDSIAIDFGLTLESEGRVGEDTNRLFGVNGDIKIDSPFKPNSPEMFDLIAAQRQANAPNATRTELRIDASCSVNFGREGVFRCQFPGGIFHDGSVNVQGRTGRTSAAASFTFPRMVRL